MYNGKLIFTVEEDKLIKNTPVYEGPEALVAYKQEVVITKDAFIECFNKWIKESEDK